MSKPSLLILYNASGTMFGHATYAYHHLRQTPGKDCSACAITHGPSLSLSESAGWSAVKARLEAGDVGKMKGKGVEVKQVHTDELTTKVKEYMRSQDMALPCVLLDKEGSLATVMKKSDLDALAGDQSKFEVAVGNNLGPLL